MTTPIRNLRCDIGGDYWYPRLDMPAVYNEPCTAPPTHRYQTDGMAEGHWQHRCATHVGWLDAPGMTIEPLVAGR